jgi:hypothetical protein
MTQDELRALLIEEVKGLSKYLSNPTDYDNAIDSSEMETWTLPVSTSFKIYWVKERSKRHLFFMMATETAHEYKVKRYDRNQKFDHYFKIIEKMDADFITAQEANPHEFASVDTYKLFGVRIKPGFRYDGVGQDITYNDSNEVEFEP